MPRSNAEPIPRMIDKSAIEEGATPRARGRILLADDDEMFRDGLARLLRRHGYDCLVAGDAEAALVLLRQQKVEAMISDIHMPGNAGLELIQSVPQISRGLPIILLTGQPGLDTATQSVRLAVAAYLVKPPEITELLGILDENIARYRKLQTVMSSREQIERWGRDLAAIEEGLRRPSSRAGGSLDYLRLTLRNMATHLTELAHSTAHATELEASSANLERLELIEALRETVNILEKTRENFKSKELGTLRRRLSQLLTERDRENPGSDNGHGDKFNS